MYISISRLVGRPGGTDQWGEVPEAEMVLNVCVCGGMYACMHVCRYIVCT